MIAQRLAEAARHHEAGRLGEAEAGYRAILRQQPRHPHALHLLGVLAHQVGRHREAIDLIRLALQVQGSHPVFHSNLASALVAAGELSEAVAHCREALRGKPDYPDALLNLGIALHRQDKLEEAEAALREALRLSPKQVEARCNLGVVLEKLGKIPEALSCLEDAVRLAPQHAPAHNDLGGVLAACGRYESAYHHLREALRLQPRFTPACNNLGILMRDVDQLDEALGYFREAMRLDPDYVRARHNVAHILEIQGKIEEALAEYRETLRRSPHHPATLASLSKLAQQGYCQLSEEEIERMRAQLARPDLTASDQSQLHFALAWALDKAGDCAGAFEHCRRGNELRQAVNQRLGVTFGSTAHRQYVERLIAAFSPAYFERAAALGTATELPVFIVGMLRSGTTLTEQILASHSQVHGAGELRDMGRLISTLPQHLGSSAEYPECLDSLHPSTAQAVADEYLQALRRRGGARSRVIDKMPFNFLHLGLIATLFPQARIIHCRRDPLDTCLSCYFQNFSDPLPFTRDLRTLGEYYRAYERLMAHWAQVLPVSIFELGYEELTADPESTTRRLLAYCGLEWDDNCLRFSQTDRSIRTASNLQVRQPMYRSSVGRWKRYAAHLQPLVDALKADNQSFASAR